MSTQTDATEHYVQRNDGRVYYKKMGQGQPVIFLHGGGQGGSSFDNVVPAIARGFTCYVLDLPGHDHSDLPPRRYSIDDFADSVVDVMEEAGLRSAHFLGNHTGATVSIYMAAKRPERVNRLVVEDSPGWDLREGNIIMERWFKPTYGEDGLPPVVPYEEAVKRNPDLDRETHARRNRREGREWINVCHVANTGLDVASLMGKIQAPTLVIFQEEDPLRIREQRFAEEIKGSVVRVLTGPGDTAHHYSPEEFVKEVMAFL